MRYNVILSAACLLCLVSCVSGSSYEGSFSPVSNFEVDFDYNKDKKDSLYFGPSFMGDSFLAFMNADRTEVTSNNYESPALLGGFGMSSRMVRWKLAGGEKTEGAMLLAGEGEEAEKTLNDNLFMSVFQKLDGNEPAKNSYAVFYNSPEEMPEHDVVFMQINGGTWTPKSCMIANTAFTVARATGLDISNYPESYAEYPEYQFKRHVPAVPGPEDNPDGGTEEQEGDYIRIVAKGYKGDSKQETGKAEIYLVDFIDGQEDSVMTSWTRLDLSKLGEVDCIDFDVEYSNPIAEAGFPVYFCLDNLVSSVYIKF